MKRISLWERKRERRMGWLIFRSLARLRGETRSQWATEKREPFQNARVRWKNTKISRRRNRQPLRARVYILSSEAVCPFCSSSSSLLLRLPLMLLLLLLSLQASRGFSPCLPLFRDFLFNLSGPCCARLAADRGWPLLWFFWREVQIRII